MGQLVYIKVSMSLIDDLPNFFRKLKRYVGWFRIESQDLHDIDKQVITISFYTDKVNIKEGGCKQVDIEARSNKRGSWFFTSINYFDI